MSLDYSGDDGFSLNMDIDVFRDLKSNILALDIGIVKCVNKEALDTCEKISNVRTPGLCNVINLSGVGWDGIRDGFQPSLRCPQKKGHYVGKGISLNPNMFKLFPLEGYYWRMNGSLFEGRQYLASLCFEFVVLNIKQQ